MTLNELGAKLGDMYHNAPKGEKVSNILLFAIKYAKQIKESKYSQLDILRQAKITESHNIHISTGIKLEKYVTIKD